MRSNRKLRVVDLTPDNFFDHLLDPDRRRMLAEALDAERDWRFPLHSRFLELATAVADADGLGRAVFALLDDAAYEDRLLQAVLANPHTPEDALWEAYRLGRGITALGCRRGPRPLLEALAEEHGSSEAITTLALYHYADEDDDAFRQFVERHRSDETLRESLRLDLLLPERRRALVADLIMKE